MHFVGGSSSFRRGQVEPEPPPGRIDWAEVDRFLQLIGRHGGSDGLIVFAVYPPGGKGSRHYPAAFRQVLPKTPIQARLSAEPSHSLGVIINAPAPLPDDWGSLPEHSHWDGGPLKTWGAQNHHIARFVGGYSECDGGLPIDDQLALPARAGLPPPSLIIFTGGKSIHFYWLLRQGETFTDHQIARRLQKALAAAIEHVCPEAGVDKGISSASHVMRCPGGYHPKTGQSTRILVDDGPRYSAAELLSLTERIESQTGTEPPPPREPRPPADPVNFTADGSGRNPNASQWFDRASPQEQLELAASMLQTIPPRGASGSGTYNDALAAVAALAGHFGADGAQHVIDLAGWDDPAAAADWDTGDKVADLAASSRTGIGALIKAARARGWEHPHADQIEQAKAGKPQANSSAPPAAVDDDDLPPAPTPERLAEIEQEITALEHDAEAAEAAAPDRESALLAIADLSVKWAEDPDQVEAIADTIGHYLAASDDYDQLIPLRDRLCAAAKGAPKKHLQKKIEHACDKHRAALQSYGERIGVLIAERDAHQIAIQQRQRRHEQVAAKEQRRQQLNLATGMEAVLLAAGDGWVANEDGECTESRLTPGALAGSVREALGDRLGFDEMRLLPAVDRQALPPNILQLLYVKLSGQGWIISKEQAVDGVSTPAFDNPFNPVRLYLEDIEADERIEPIDLEDFYALFHVTDPQQQRYLLLMLLAAVWRAMEPGCSLKICVIFAGEQTTYKSEAIRQLCGPDWLVDTRQQQDKDTLLALYASWFYELGEIDALMDKRHAGDLKNLVSPASDMLRPPFWSAMCRFKRASIFVGTTNKPEFFTDETGNHRYPVVAITEPIDLEGITANRDRIWKAAVALYRQGVKPWLTQDDTRALEARNQEFIQSDPWLPIVQQWTEGGITVTTGRTREGFEITEHRMAPVEFTTTAALIGSGVARQDALQKPHEMRMAAVLKQLGFVKGRVSRAGGRAWLWRRRLPPPGTPPEAGAPGPTSWPNLPNLAQPESEQVGQGQKADKNSDPSSPAQPAQPFSSSGVREEDTHRTDLLCVCAPPIGASGGSEVGQVGPPPKPPAPQGILAAQPPDRGWAEVGPEVGPEPPYWLATLQELAERVPDAPSAELVEMLWSGFGIRATEVEVMHWLADWPPA